ncbi:anti-sigma factor antagonist [Bacillus sp. Bva_UNVM-123]|uniref:anti-sigma factor antagonist n=1 Tax=Bacillus sp. Bva_UNVM-123 TaxID=2829798 RepID=UPI00391FC222
MKLHINRLQNENEILATVAGEIDAYTAPKLREELFPYAEGNYTIIVNLKDVSYLDSTGLGVFVSLFKQLKKNNGELKLTDLSDRLKRLFKITGLSNIMDISTNSEDGGR